MDRARIIVIDDGSTDDSVELIKRYATEYKIPLELFVHEKNEGLLRTILQAYRMLDTKYFTVLDADDGWLSAEKLKKAIVFLEAHKGYFAYCSNYMILHSSGEAGVGFSKDLPSRTFTKVGEVQGHFQTPSAVFRNFFTPDLLDKMESVSKGQIVHVVETDPFRNYFAFGLGKVYFENSIDAFWRFDVGEWGVLDYFNKYAISMQEYTQLFEFYAQKFGVDENAMNALRYSFSCYIKVVDFFVNSMKNLTLFDFKGGKYFRDRYKDYGESDVEKLVNVLLEQIALFKKFGLNIENKNK